MANQKKVVDENTGKVYPTAKDCAAQLQVSYQTLKYNLNYYSVKRKEKFRNLHYLIMETG